MRLGIRDTTEISSSGALRSRYEISSCPPRLCDIRNVVILLRGLTVFGILPPAVRASSARELAETVVAGIGASRSVVLARSGAAADSDGIRLLASAGNASGGGSYTRLDGEFREMAIRTATIASIAARREPFVVQGIRGDEESS